MSREILKLQERNFVYALVLLSPIYVRKFESTFVRRRNGGESERGKRLRTRLAINLASLLSLLRPASSMCQEKKGRGNAKKGFPPSATSAPSPTPQHLYLEWWRKGGGREEVCRFFLHFLPQNSCLKEKKEPLSAALLSPFPPPPFPTPEKKLILFPPAFPFSPLTIDKVDGGLCF